MQHLTVIFSNGIIVIREKKEKRNQNLNQKSNHVSTPLIPDWPKFQLCHVRNHEGVSPMDLPKFPDVSDGNG